MEQLLALAGGLDWFGRGSRVIVTTRDKHLLTCHGIERTHAVKGLNGTEALELLRWMAFKNDEVPSSYEAILNRAVTYACGFPLAIVTIGSNLFGRSVENWELTLDEYEKIPNKEIQKILRVSYDALEEKEQSVFLDIACCFKGCKWTEVKQILHAHYGHPIEHHVAVLAEKSLIDHWEFDGNVTLHDLIEYMGKEVVRQESPYKPGERSRLWFHDDIFQVLKENTGTGNIEMIYLNPSMENVIEWNAKGFKKMTNLKTLIIENVHFARGPEYLPSSLRYLKWNGCPSKALSSCISTKEFNYMKVLTLDYCKYLTHIPNVSGLPNLEKFSFENCHSLLAIHNSVGYLNKLEILNAKNCIKLESFPPLRLPSLKELKLSHCSSLKSFPKLLCKMTNIKDIWLNHTSIGELPLSFESFSELRDLQIYQNGMFRFPKHNEKMNSIVFSNVKSLTLNTISLSDECLPILLKWFVNVKHLDLSQTNFKILPECLNECHLLRILNLDFCESLEEIRGLPPNLEEFSAIKCESLSFSSRRMLLKELNEAGCTKISLPNGRDGIPDWFEHQTKGNTISFWFRRKIPSITFIILSGMSTETDFRLLVNDFNLFLTGCIYDKYVVLPSEHAFLFDLELKRHIYENFENKPNMKETLKKNEWNQVELNWGKDDFYPSAQMGIHVVKEKSNTKEHDLSEDEIFMPDEIKKLSSAQIGIHEKSNTEEDVIFTNPYRTTTTTKPYYSQALFPNPIGKIRKFRPTLKKQRFVEVLKTENLRSLEETKSDGVKSLEVSETESLQQQDLALLSSGMQNMVLTDKKEKEQHD